MRERERPPYGVRTLLRDARTTTRRRAHSLRKRNVLFEKQREFNAKRKMKPERLVQTRALASLQQGEWFEGVVRVIKPHGAWVSIGTEIDGFMHVRDLSNTEFVSDASETLPSRVLASQENLRAAYTQNPPNPPREGNTRAYIFSACAHRRRAPRGRNGARLRQGRGRGEARALALPAPSTTQRRLFYWERGPVREKRIIRERHGVVNLHTRHECRS